MLVRANHTADAESAQVLTPPEAAAFLKISERTLWTLTKAGTLPAVRIGTQWRYARATVSNHTKKAKQFFNAAAEEGQLEVSPFAGLVAGSQVNDERKQFVTAEDIGKVIAVAPNVEWRLLIALARYV